MTDAARNWSSRLAVYKSPDDRRAIFEITVTILPLAGMWILMWHLAAAGPWLPLLLAVPAATLLVRLFMIQHDCGHNAFLSSRKANDWTGRVLGVLTLNPNAQRSLGKAGPGKETTSDLIDNDKILKTDRAVNFIKFVNRVMDNVEKSIVNEGFFGSVSFVLPASFTKAKFDKMTSDDTIVGKLTAKADMGESFIHIADGQGRIVGFHAMERELVLKITRLKDAIKRIEKKGQSASEEKAELAEAEAALNRVRQFLSHNDLPFVLYWGFWSFKYR